MDPTPVKILFPKTGQAAQADFGDSLVDAVFRHDLPVRFKCERAVCTTCLVEVLKGVENLSPPGARELQTLKSAGLEGRFRLACQVELRGDVELDHVPLADPRRRPPASGGGDGALF